MAIIMRVLDVAWYATLHRAFNLSVFRGPRKIGQPESLSPLLILSTGSLYLHQVGGGLFCVVLGIHIHHLVGAVLKWMVLNTSGGSPERFHSSQFYWVGEYPG